MAILSKIYIIACLFLNFLMCQRQEYPNYSLNEQNSENSMPKYPRSGEMDTFDQWQPNSIQDSQLGIPICPAENPSDVSYETLHAGKKNYKKIVKDEDDDETLDIAAADDDDDDDDHKQNVGDDHLGDDKYITGRISCLMGNLEDHIQVMVNHVKNLKLHLATPKGTSKSKNDETGTPSKTSAKKTKDFSKSPPSSGEDRKSPDSEEDTLVALGKKLRTEPLPGLSKTLANLQKRKDIPLYGSESEFQGGVRRREGLKEEPSPRRYGAYEAKLRSLMANRDIIERNMMNILGPRRGERM